VLNFDGGKTVRAGLLIGADGKASVVRDVTVGDGLADYTGTMIWRGITDQLPYDDLELPESGILAP